MGTAADPVRELKVRAELLHRRLQAPEPDAAELARLRALPEFRRADAAALAHAVKANEVQRKHCLAAVAREVGFAGWEHARRVLDGDASVDDFGKLLYGAESGARLHPWFATYEEARACHAELTARGETRYLLAYQRHFFVAEGSFVEALGLDPDDADWRAIGWDWARPRDVGARRRLYAKLLGRGDDEGGGGARHRQA